MNEQQLQQWLNEQRAHYQPHLDDTSINREILPAPTFEEWLGAAYLETRDALQELWNLLVEYDLNTNLEELAQENGNEAWAEVLGTIEAVRLVLGNALPVRAFS